MREIELKAHVYNRPQTEKMLNTFAFFRGRAEKSDAYWYNPEEKPEVQTVRIRSQKTFPPEGSHFFETIITFKSKELRDNIEVNEETEFCVSDTAAFQCFLEKSGYHLQRIKEKKVASWIFEDALIELCTVPPLGNFIEIEIRTSDQEKAIEQYREKLFLILEKSGVDKTHIETAYYSEMLEKADLSAHRQEQDE